MKDRHAMSICVCGWYFDRFDAWYMSLHRVKKKYPVFVVCNRADPFQETFDLPYAVRTNTGLEWGAYNHYLMHHWDSNSAVLFCHDDIVLNPVVVNGEVLPPEWIFEQIAAADVDQAYVFGSRAEDVENHGQHGRMVYMSRAFLLRARDMGGFWSDAKNAGYTSGDDAHLKESFGCLGYNSGIIAFHAQAEAMGGRVHRKIYIPALDLARRGIPSARQLHYGLWTERVSQIVTQAKDQLNIGSGDNPIKGSTNVDLFSLCADVRADATSLPFDNDSWDLIQAHHLIEHLSLAEACRALAEWRRVLRPGGHVFLSCPDLATCAQALHRHDADSPQLWDGLMHVIYGNEAPGMRHRFGYCKRSLKQIIMAAGFDGVEVMTAIGMRPTPSLLAIGHKPQSGGIE